MDTDLSVEQMEKALKLCDIASLEDFTLAVTILEECQWNLEHARTLMVTAPNPNPNSPDKPLESQASAKELTDTLNNEQFEDLDPYEYQTYQDHQQSSLYNQYEYEFQKQEDFNNKKNMFNNQYISIPLNKTTSETPNKLENQLSNDRILSKDYARHRHEYQANLLKNSRILCETLLSKKSEETRQFYANHRKNENNKRFLLHLHQKYGSRINFTFGTFFLNLLRSYLDEKSFLVYVHKSEFEDHKAVEMLLTQREITHFINSHFISYGMFDNSDDYEIVQKYVAMKQLPAFVLFRFDKKNMKEQFVSHYAVMRKQEQNLMEWLAYNIGVTLKKKQGASHNKQEQDTSLVKEQYLKMSDIINQQNLEYEQMEKMYQLKREKSKCRKESINAALQQIQELKESFNSEPQEKAIMMKFRLPLTGKSIVRRFGETEKIDRMFDYVHCYGREEFEDQWADFDLSQTFPRLSLNDKKDEQIGSVFQDSEHENIIVKQL